MIFPYLVKIKFLSQVITLMPKNIPKILNRENKTNIFSNINNDIEIDFKNISAPLSERIKNFKLIGKS